MKAVAVLVCLTACLRAASCRGFSLSTMSSEEMAKRRTLATEEESSLAYAARCQQLDTLCGAFTITASRCVLLDTHKAVNLSTSQGDEVSPVVRSSVEQRSSELRI